MSEECHGTRANYDRSLLRDRSRSARMVMALAVLVILPGISAADDAELWNALRSGESVALLRHALAPGSGDPPEFTLGDCSTQRNLSDDGRAQAERIGERFRANGIRLAQVYSSQWCRCRETARLLGLGAVQELPALNSFYQRYERRERQTRELEAWIVNRNLDGPRVLVTHQVNISALTDVYPAEGTLVVIRRSEVGGITVIGTINAE